MASKMKQSNAYVLFAAMSEIQLKYYENTTILKLYDPALHTKLKNLQANFERVSETVFKKFSDQDQLVFFDMINIMEALLEEGGNPQRFSMLLNLIKSFQNNEITIINTNEELVKVAEGLKMEEVRG
jgi:hypothetical protein